MAKIACKGTKLQLEIAMVFTDIAQIISLNGPEGDVETFDATALDSGTGKEHQTTGYVEHGEVSGELFADLALTTHQELTDRIQTPVDGDSWKLVFSDLEEVAFSGPFKKFGLKVQMNDGLKADFAVKVSGTPTYPT